MESITQFFRAPYKFYNWMMSKSDPRTINWPLCGGPFPMLLLIFSYVSFVKVLGPRWMKNRPPFQIENIIILYNILMVILSAGFFIFGGIYSYIPPWGKFNWICEPIDYSLNPDTLRLLNIGWWFLILKIVEFTDTIFFVLRKKFNQVSNLHVIHHSLVAWGVWVGNKYGLGGSNIFFPFINCFVHTLMYSYYCLAALGPKMKKYLWWKKHLTIIQMVQFVVAFIHASIPIFYDCGYPKEFSYTVIAHAFLFMVLFVNFYRSTYKEKKRKADELRDSIGKSNGFHSTEKDGIQQRQNLLKKEM